MKKKVLFILIPIFVLLLISIIMIAVENYKAKDIVYDKTPYENTSVSYNSYGKPTKFKVYDSSKELIKEIKLSSLFALADEKIVYRNKDKFYILDTSNVEIKKLGKIKNYFSYIDDSVVYKDGHIYALVVTDSLSNYTVSICDFDTVNYKIEQKDIIRQNEIECSFAFFNDKLYFAPDDYSIYAMDTSLNYTDSEISKVEKVSDGYSIKDMYSDEDYLYILKGSKENVIIEKYDKEESLLEKIDITDVFLKYNPKAKENINGLKYKEGFFIKDEYIYFSGTLFKNDEIIFEGKTPAQSFGYPKALSVNFDFYGNNIHIFNFETKEYNTLDFNLSDIKDDEHKITQIFECSGNVIVCINDKNELYFLSVK